MASTAPNPETTDEPDLIYTVKSFGYELPHAMLTEGRATNDAFFFVRFPQYSMSVHQFCHYKFVETEFLTERIDDPNDCIYKLDLTFWSKERKRNILLDSFEIFRESLKDRKSVDALTVYKNPEETTHFVMLAMFDHTCRKMEYTVGEDFKVSRKDFVVDCKVVEKIDKENNAWVAEHLSKAVEATEKAAKREAENATGGAAKVKTTVIGTNVHP